MKNNKKEENCLSELMALNSSLGLTVCYALEAAKTLDQALAIARFVKLSYRIEIAQYIQQAVAEIGNGLSDDVRFQTTSCVATKVIDDYSSKFLAAAQKIDGGAPSSSSRSVS